MHKFSFPILFLLATYACLVGIVTAESNGSQVTTQTTPTITFTPDPTPNSLSPSLSIMVTPSIVQVGDIITVTGTVQHLGLPYYYLHVDGAQFLQITHDNQIVSSGTNSKLTLISASASMSQAQFLFQATSEGILSFSINATGETLSNGAWVWSSASSSVETVNIGDVATPTPVPTDTPIPPTLVPTCTPLWIPPLEVEPIERYNYTSPTTDVRINSPNPTEWFPDLITISTVHDYYPSISTHTITPTTFPVDIPVRITVDGTHDVTVSWTLYDVLKCDGSKDNYTDSTSVDTNGELLEIFYVHPTRTASPTPEPTCTPRSFPQLQVDPIERYDSTASITNLMIDWVNLDEIPDVITVTVTDSYNPVYTITPTTFPVEIPVVVTIDGVHDVTVSWAMYDVWGCDGGGYDYTDSTSTDTNGDPLTISYIHPTITPSHTPTPTPMPTYTPTPTRVWEEPAVHVTSNVTTPVTVGQSFTVSVALTNLEIPVYELLIDDSPVVAVASNEDIIWEADPLASLEIISMSMMGGDSATFELSASAPIQTLAVRVTGEEVTQDGAYIRRFITEPIDVSFAELSPLVVTSRELAHNIVPIVLVVTLSITVLGIISVVTLKKRDMGRAEL